MALYIGEDIAALRNADTKETSSTFHLNVSTSLGLHCVVSMTKRLRLS